MSRSPQLDHTEILRIRLEMKRGDHRDLDDAIRALHKVSHSDPLTIKRLKRQKLALRDEIARIKDELTPDIIA